MTNYASRGFSRWCATVTYRTDAGPVDNHIWLRELGDLQDRIEQGPHWDTVVKIGIQPINHIDSPVLTIEQADKM